MRWLYAAKNIIPKAERPHLLIMFRRIFFAKNTEEHLKAEVEFFNDEEVSRHPNCVKHVSDDIQRMEHVRTN